MSETHRVFVSYSHRDRRHLARLRIHLRPIERTHQIDIWDDKRIEAGSDWRADIAANVAAARVAILLVSADFLASDFIAEHELPSLLAKAESEGCLIWPVIVGHCSYTEHELGRFQAVNDPARPLAALPVAQRERVWKKLANNLAAAFEDRSYSEDPHGTVELLLQEKKLATTSQLPLKTESYSEDPHGTVELLLQEALERLVMEGKNGAYLIAEVGEYYVQYLLNREDGVLHIETISNEFLPEDHQLSAREAKRMVDLGFEPPDEGTPNYNSTLLLQEDELIPMAAAVGRAVLTEVFMVAEGSKPDLTLDLEG